MESDQYGLDGLVVGVDPVNFSGVLVRGVHLVQGLVRLATPEQRLGIVGGLELTLTTVSIFRELLIFNNV